MTGMGCDLLSTPPVIEPAAEKMKWVTQGILGILLCSGASLAALTSLLGVVQVFSAANTLLQCARQGLRVQSGTAECCPGSALWVLSEMAHALASSSRDHGVEDVEPTPLLSSVSVSHGPLQPRFCSARVWSG